MYRLIISKSALIRFISASVTSANPFLYPTLATNFKNQISLQKLKTRITIVGAGPAGATTSMMLSKMGIPHTIVDASLFPRDKICGDGLDLNVIRVLNHIDPSIAQDLLPVNENYQPSQGMRIILPNGRHVSLMRNSNGKHPFIEKPVFYISKRADFDNLLVNKLDPRYADIHLGTRINKIERHDGIWTLFGSRGTEKIEIQSDFLVGADGDHSVVLRHLGARQIDRSSYAAAVRQYWKGVEGIHSANLIDFYFPKSLPLSYFWIFPLPNGEANVGFGMASNYAAKNKINITKAFSQLIKTDPYLMERFKNAQPMETVKGWGIPLSVLRRKAHGDGWLLVGDAASIVCPTSGEGIGSGMLSGYVAAKFLGRAVEQNNFKASMFTLYDREIHRRLRKEEKLYRFVNTIPAFVFTAGINLVVSNRWLQKWVNKEMHNWLITAYQTPIQVNMD